MLPLTLPVAFSSLLCTCHAYWWTDVNILCHQQSHSCKYTNQLFENLNFLCGFSDFTISECNPIERRTHYVTLPWQQDFWMTTNQKSHLKVYSHYFKLQQSYSISFNLANLGKFSLGPHLMVSKFRK